MRGRDAKKADDLVGVLGIGGTHVTSAVVDRRTALLVPGTLRRRTIDSAASAADLVGDFAAAIVEVDAAPQTPWAIAIPGPFDYRRGVGRFTGVGKFDALRDINVAARLHAALPRLNADFTFVNDADAFAIGEWRKGVASAAARCVGITLGTGVGSSFLDNGVPVTDGPTVPPQGRVHRLRIGTSDLEDVVSRRAILARYLSAPDTTGSADLDVHDVFERGRRGDDWAALVLRDAFAALGASLAPWLARFEATVVAVGGAMTGSWDLILPALQHGLVAAGSPPDIALRPSADTEQSTLTGAATSMSPASL